MPTQSMAKYPNYIFQSNLQYLNYPLTWLCMTKQSAAYSQALGIIQSHKLKVGEMAIIMCLK
jgi:hypothetical protein